MIVERVSPCGKVKNFTFLDLFPISSLPASYTVFINHKKNYHPMLRFCVLVLPCFLFPMSYKFPFMHSRADYFLAKCLPRGVVSRISFF